jgi:hypothetical protein
LFLLKTVNSKLEQKVNLVPLLVLDPAAFGMPTHCIRPFAKSLVFVFIENCQQQARTKSQLTATAGAWSCSLWHANTLRQTLRQKFSFCFLFQTVNSDPMLFEDDVIKIDPVEGDIWPNSNFEVQVIFKPREPIQYTRTAFCDITGRQSRLPLRIRGDGAGPKVEFSFNELDMGNIFIGSTHMYEIVMANKGDIDAIYR